MALPVTELYALFLERRPAEKERVEQARLLEAKVCQLNQLDAETDSKKRRCMLETLNKEARWNVPCLFCPACLRSLKNR